MKGLLFPLKKEACFKREFTMIKLMGQQGRECFIFVAACMKCVLHFLPSFCVTFYHAIRTFYIIVYFRHHRVTFVQQLVFTV